MDDEHTDICGAVTIVAGKERRCYLSPHVKLRLVKPGDTAKKIMSEQTAHVFESRYPYPIKEY